MSTKVVYNNHGDNHTHHEHHGHHDHEMAVRDVSLYGFWIYLMTDCILFGTLFTAFVLFSVNYPPYAFNMNVVLAETLILLTSSFTFGMAVLYMYKKQLPSVLFWIVATFLLGAAFLYFEIEEFILLTKAGHGIDANAYFGSFFALVGTHGAHVFLGMIWMAFLFVNISINKITERTTTKLLILSLFWHFLDIIWIFVFSVVYLIGGL